MFPDERRYYIAIGSLHSNSLLLHIDEVRCFIQEKGFHILPLNETKLENTIADDLLEVEGYILHRKDRNRCGLRGVVVYVTESLKHHRKNDLPKEG